ncbi:phosphonate ABC transporter ATP-binding protein [Halosimplex halophilum]|uniref:phosphonate ABC transporter ATP-binding protein n=1 Tax=Halosimplex halophilum TaxID=2559572 RepID=UPI00107F25A5|nr:phosphonate ABC transporter ATP-binding protein [Halosimplex halophilum]
MTTVEFDNVTKVYGDDTVALDDVSVEIEEGEFVVLLGPSGAGKSTFLRVLNGLTTPSAGSVSIGGRAVEGNRREVGMVFQEHYLVESLSAYGNALTGALSRNGFFRSLAGGHDEADKRAALDALDTVGLLEDAGQRAGSMSGGQKQRVGIARALVQEPELLLADEPVASLDPKAARDVMGYLKRAADEHDLTTVTSLHQVNIAREFGDRFLGVKDGQLVFDGREGDLTMDVIDDIYYDGDSPEGVVPGDADADDGGDLGGATPGDAFDQSATAHEGGGGA